jgi:hypothetical protein
VLNSRNDAWESCNLLQGVNSINPKRYGALAHELLELLTQGFFHATNAGDVEPVAIFADLSLAFGVVDASPIPIYRSQSNQND